MLSADSGNFVYLTETEIKPAGGVLARAFQDYPLFANFIPEASKRNLLLPDIFEFLTRYGVLYGEVYATSPGLEGIAVWFPSEKAEMTLLRMIRIWGFRLIYDYVRTRRSISRLLSYNEYALKVQNRHLHCPHWYLFLIGVDPTFQGKGYANALIKPMLTRIDKEHLSCYLETQDEKNISIYERYGFEVVQVDTVPGTDLKHWAMLRKEPNPCEQSTSVDSD